VNRADDEFLEESSALLPGELSDAFVCSMGQTDTEGVVAEKPAKILSQSLGVAGRRE
jgi:hypothetical protein